MRPAPIILAAALALGLAGCSKAPQEDCEGSFKSWTRCLEGHDWEAAFELLTPPFQKKIGSFERLARGMEDEWKGAKDFEFKSVNVAEAVSAGTCTVSGAMDYTVKIRGQNPEDHEDEYFSWIFRKSKDGRWRIELPGYEKISSY